MKLIIFLLITMLSSSTFANAVAFGQASVSIVTLTKSCDINSASSLQAVKLTKELAKEDADEDCDLQFPGSRSRGIQRVTNELLECLNLNTLKSKFSAIYFCH